MDKTLIFLLGLPTGILLIVFRQKIVQFTGKLNWAEEKLGPGGTYGMVIILGLLVWIGCMMYALGSFDQIFGFLAKFF